MRSILLFFFVMCVASSNSQELSRTNISGRITSNTTDLEGVYVINKRTEKATITEKDGYFSLAAIPGDLLIFSAIHLKEERLLLNLSHFEKGLLYVKMNPIIIQLSEVVVRRYDNINAVSLGISPSGILHRTQAERKLATASSSKLNPMGLDPILNYLSGRTAMLKKEVEVEKKLSYIDLLDNMFAEEHFVKDFKIPLEYVKGFKFFAVENDKFTIILKQKNKTTIDFLMGELAIKYLEIISVEKE